MLLRYHFAALREQTRTYVWGWHTMPSLQSWKQVSSKTPTTMMAEMIVDMFIRISIGLPVVESDGQLQASPQTMLFRSPNLDIIPQHAIHSFPVYSHSRKSRPGLPVERFIPLARPSQLVETFSLRLAVCHKSNSPDLHLHQHWHPAFCISDPWILGLVGPWGNTRVIPLTILLSAFFCSHTLPFSSHVNLSLTIAIALHCMILIGSPFTDSFLFQAYRDLARYAIPKFSVILQFISLFIHFHTPCHVTHPSHPLSSHSRISVIHTICHQTT